MGANAELSAIGRKNAEQYNALVLALAALMGVMGTAAFQTAGSDPDSLCRMTATAFPQLTAWLISYLMYHSPGAAKGMTLQRQELLGLPAHREESSGD